MTVVRVPATSANLGAGFDALGLALGRRFELALDVAADDPAAADAGHPAVRAFVAAGGAGAVAVRTDFPPGRGLGFSGAARVAGVVAAAVQRGDDWVAGRDELLGLAAELEGHADNAAASMYGGLVVTAGGHSRRVSTPPDFAPRVVLWIPDRETSTKQSRTTLPETVPLPDAVFNLGRAALLVAGWSAGDLSVLAVATEDRWHQRARLTAVPESAAALAALRDAGHAAWLSGSGPTVAALVADDVAGARGAAALADLPGGRTEIVTVDAVGAVVDSEGSHHTWS